MREDKRMGGYEKKEYNVYGRVGRHCQEFENLKNKKYPS